MMVRTVFLVAGVALGGSYSSALAGDKALLAAPFAIVTGAAARR